jgi:hypothetical protein
LENSSNDNKEEEKEDPDVYKDEDKELYTMLNVCRHIQITTLYSLLL